MIANRSNFQFNLTSASINAVEMMATTNSDANTGAKRRAEGRNSSIVRTFSRIRLFIFLAMLAATGISRGEDAPEAKFARRAEQNYQEARQKFQSNTNDADAAWQLGRACFDWADVAKNDGQRETIANEGIAVCRQLIARDAKSAAGHYYLGLDLGELAQTKTLGALRIVQEMEREFKAVRDLDPKFDHAGPDRNLGLLYLEAPGWPASIGSKPKARKHLERAVELSPDYPENHLCLLEAYLKWDDQKSLQRETKVVEELLPKARKEFTGDTWAQSWADWNKRWEKIQKKAVELKK